MTRPKQICVISFLLLLLLSACTGSAPAITPSPQNLVEQPVYSATVPIVTGTPSPIPPIITPGVSPTATFTDLPTITVTFSPSPTPPHPLTIDWLRQQDYPGGEITIEELLEPGYNYNRYIVSYISEGLKINALLTVPTGAKPQNGWPVVIFNHGYIPPDQYRTTERYVDYVIAFAANGYIVLRSDYRGHAFSEGEARGAYGTPDYTVDVLNAVSAIQNYPDADPDRIGMWGHSMGGYITLRAMVVNPDIKAGVIWAGVVGSYPDLLAKWTRSGSPHPALVSDQARKLARNYSRRIWHTRGEPRILGLHLRQFISGGPFRPGSIAPRNSG